MTKNEITVKDFEEVLEREITKFGNGSHIILPQKHEGKKAMIIIKPKIIGYWIHLSDYSNKEFLVARVDKIDSFLEKANLVEDNVDYGDTIVKIIPVEEFKEDAMQFRNRKHMKIYYGNRQNLIDVLTKLKKLHKADLVKK